MERISRLVKYVTRTGLVELGMVDQTEAEFADVRVVIPGMVTQQIVTGVPQSSSGEKNTWQLFSPHKPKVEQWPPVTITALEMVTAQEMSAPVGQVYYPGKPTIEKVIGIVTSRRKERKKSSKM